MSIDKEVVNMYVDQNKSTYEISKAFDTYPNKIRRILLNNGIQMKDKSEAQKNALKNGSSKIPTLGAKRTTEEKIKISSSMKKRWEEMDEDEYQRRVVMSKQRWEDMSLEEKEKMTKAATKAIQKAGKEGSKLEKFISGELAKHGHRIETHKKNLLVNQNLEIDMYLPDFKTIIEIDGPSHFLPIWGWEKLNKQIKADQHKTGLILNKGFTIIRVKSLKDSVAIADQYLLRDKLLDILSKIDNYFSEETRKYIEVEI